MMTPELEKRLMQKCRVIEDNWHGAMDADTIFKSIRPLLTEAYNAGLDAAEARAKELEAALEFSYTLACRGVDRIDEENKTCGPRLSLAHRKRLTIMCNQIKTHKDKWLRAEADRIEKESKEKDNG